MFKSTLSTYPNAGANGGISYGDNLGRAARAFLAALLAVEPASEQVDTPDVIVSEKIRLQGVREMLSLAREFDLIMPNQAAELRYAAGRDIC
jgi:hypothetical protein